MIETTFREYDCHDEDSEHDDYMSAEDYDVREYYRNGWDELRYERQRF